MSITRAVLHRLMVEPGSPANLAERDPSWKGGKEFAHLHGKGAKKRAEEDARAVPGRDRPGAGAAVGRTTRRSLLVDLPGHGRRRQGRHHQARHVGGQPAGLRGHLVQAAVGRGARPRLPLARGQQGARTGPHRHLQPLPLRGGARGAGAPGAAGAPAAASRALAAPGSGRSATRASTTFERHLARNGTTIVKFFLHVSKEEQRRRLPRPPGGAGQGVEVRRRRRGRAPALGRLHEGLSRTPSPPPRRSGRRGTSSPPTTSRSCAPWWRACWSRPSARWS